MSAARLDISASLRAAGSVLSGVLEKKGVPDIDEQNECDVPCGVSVVQVASLLEVLGAVVVVALDVLYPERGEDFSELSFDCCR